MIAGIDVSFSDAVVAVIFGPGGFLLAWLTVRPKKSAMDGNDEQHAEFYKRIVELEVARAVNDERMVFIRTSLEEIKGVLKENGKENKSRRHSNEN